MESKHKPMVKPILLELKMGLMKKFELGAIETIRLLGNKPAPNFYTYSIASLYCVEIFESQDCKHCELALPVSYARHKAVFFGQVTKQDDECKLFSSPFTSNSHSIPQALRP